MSITPDPASLGKKVTISVFVGAGPVCKLKVKYPSGAYASLPAPTRPDSTRWVWSWTIPQSAQPGTAHLTETCTYGGVARSGTGSFTIAGITWMIEGLIPATFSSTASGFNAQVTIHGTWPGNPNSEQRLSCIFTLVTSTGTSSAGANIFFYPLYGLGPFDMYLPIGPLGSAAIGPATWTLKCSNPGVDPSAFEYDHGSMEIT